MRQTNFEHVLIFSVYRPNKPDNELQHAIACQRLTRMVIPYVELLGSYNGVTEKSILVTRENRDVVVDLCRQHKQECYMESDSSRQAWLMFPDGNRQQLGYLSPVDEDSAKRTGNWSYRTDINQYYVTEFV